MDPTGIGLQPQEWVFAFDKKLLSQFSLFLTCQQRAGASETTNFSEQVFLSDCINWWSGKAVKTCGVAAHVAPAHYNFSPVVVRQTATAD